MKIINPLYDNAFKHLMDNEQIAKLVLSIILSETVISLQSKPQETPIYTENTRTTSRYDFKAVIRNSEGEDRTVLIELQKYKHPDPIMRFREYVAETYRKEETFIDSNGGEKTVPLPIVTVYILGYKVTKADILALEVGRFVRDIIWGTPVTEKLDFVELLTHGCFIFQVGVKPAKLRGTQLEKFLSLFSQKLKGEASNYCIDIEVDESVASDTDLTKIVHHLDQATLDESVIRSLKYEESYEKGIRTVEQELIDMQVREFEALKKEAEALALAEQSKHNEAEALALADKERAEKEDALNQAENERKEKEKNRSALVNMVKRLKSKGSTDDEIAEDTGLSPDDIRAILS